jgi:hypothetical protein
MHQMRHIREQADGAEKQAEAAARPGHALMREASDEDAKRRYIDQKNERANEQRVARRRRADTRAGHAARAQLQPVVFADAHGAPVSIDDDEFDIGQDLVAVPFYLTNERTGLALEIDSGIALGAVEYAFGGGMRSASRPGVSIPTAGPDATRDNRTPRPGRDRSAGKSSRTPGALARRRSTGAASATYSASDSRP